MSMQMPSLVTDEARSSFLHTITILCFTDDSCLLTIKSFARISASISSNNLCTLSTV
uniref:Uncharacterized protein n=1 Tax=Hyaloperonospora arabidopsidis (strain Emoy2) TaxID=559515 RepID=M4BC61_HYAAE